MRHLTGATRTAFLLFFASHIPITLLVDGQAFLPHSIYPQAVLDVRQWYASTFKDALMAEPFEPWFKSFVACEIVLQLPFFVYAVRALLNPPTTAKGKGLFRTLSLIYGSHTATTLIPILIATLADETTTAREKAALFGFYLPYLIFPVWLVAIAVVSEDVFGGSRGCKEGKKK
uniref:EXPERA domain-containing protein n=1 Tax=Odontella aurita TaxID=265563 RepID=A0A7S4N251_9STRA|mmetsp:Transcript_44393/g.135318  ORF Transcript_44393/g.135318 Transcript_44393/m.135318 type:complete len:174 (+) Transcript_44393:238-759(+)|eukprot:CAMPEP_0113553860 /NCGR_PEP_ID=MMETSP0015_2-20120614/15838_1 /TAXON_ID=2838 /ORGANISM="Odontella" /LENGTH=173 /DNA_ID=CAMNT_0000454957 /DNA_START=179 /DNA_END=700 /DNA_ORIENTATION=+ /assembly_acc=CAM_ASM_000160